MEKRVDLERRGKEPSKVVELNLDNCRATNIEGLTDEYTSLEQLSMINVGLTSLKGFPKLPKLRVLELSDNRISTGLGALQDCPLLSHLRFSNNKIKDLEAIEPLKELKELTHLDLFNNDICNLDDYRTKVFQMLPSLKYLDEADAAGNELEDSENGENGTLDEEDEVNDEEESCEEEESEGEDGPGLSALYNDNLLEDGDDESFNGEDGEEEEEEDDEEEEYQPSGKKRKVEEDGEDV